jgi:hypothetical protein
VQLDGSSPAVTTSANATQALATGSFTPPDLSVLLVAWAGNTASADTPPTPSITDNLGAHLTYTLVDFAAVGSVGTKGQSAMWTAPVATGAAMTVTVTNNSQTASQWGAALKVWVITGANGGDPVGQFGKNSAVTAGAKTASYTADSTGSRGFLVCQDWDTQGAQTAGTGCTFTGGGTGNNSGGNISYGFLLRTTEDGVAGASTAMNWTVPGTSANLNWVYAEIQPEAKATRPVMATWAAVQRASQY